MKIRQKLVLVPIIALILATMFHVITGYGFNGVKTLGTENTRYGVKVTYYKRLFTGQKLLVSLEGLGKGYTTCITLWGWAPNGSIIPLGKKCSTKTTIEIPAKPLLRYLEEWRKSLLRNHDDPNDVEPGVITMIAINKPGKAVYSLIKTAPVSITMPLRGKASIRITIERDEVRHALAKPVATWKQLEQVIAKRLRNKVRAEEWPPKEVPYEGPYYWYYQRTIAENNNAYLPVEILHLTGYLQHFRSDQIELEADFIASSKKKIGFTATFSVSTGVENVEAQFGVSGPTLVLKSESEKALLDVALLAVYNQYAKTRYFGEGVSGSLPGGIAEAYISPKGSNHDVLLAIGYKGQAALAEYCLAFDLSYIGGSVPYCTDTWANLTLHRPIEVGNKILYWYEVDNNPEDGVGVTENVYKTLVARWEKKFYGEFDKSVRIYLSDVIAEFNTIPLLGITVPVLPVLLGPEASVLPALLTPILGATVGYTSTNIETTMISLTLGAIVDKTASFSIYWVHSTEKMYYKGNYYYLGTAIFDVHVLRVVWRPHSSPPSSCTTESSGSSKA